MYSAYFGLRDNPFSITPDPGYVYLSPNHQEALAHLLYGAGEDGGFVQLTGEVGTGKTTLIRTLLEQHLENVDVALCLNPRQTVEEFVATICDELQVEYPRDSRTLKPLIDALNAHLLKTHAQGRRTVLIIDEAQNLSRDVLEQVRLLTNLETRRHKLLRIILAGQPELKRLLEREDLRQLAQRITARYHLLPLRRAETIAYVRHRLKVAGGRDDIFTHAALKSVHKSAQGVPRLINIVCDRALLGAYGCDLRQIDAATVRRAAREALGRPVLAHPLRRLILSAGFAGVIATAVGLHLSPWTPPPIFAEPKAPSAEPEPINAAPPQPALSVSAEQIVHKDASEPAPQERTIPPPETVVAARTAAPSVREMIFAAETAEDSMRKLLALWNQEPPSTVAGLLSCEALQVANLRCLAAKGDWEALRRYNLPAILTLANEDGALRQVVLRTLNVDRATLELAQGPIEIALAELEPLWSGDYQMLWRLQTSQLLIGPNSEGEPVRWLRRRLALAEGAPPLAEPVSGEFDEALREKVRRFQNSRHLTADGWVGPLTMPHLNNLAPSPGRPFLMPSSATKTQ